MIRLIAIVCLVALSACSRPVDEHPQAFPPANVTIAEVTAMAAEGYHIIERPMTIVGRVVSSDSARNFYRRVVVSDHTAGAELLSGFYNNFLVLPEGTLLAVQLQGLAVDTDGGVLRVGVPANAGATPIPQPFGSLALWRQSVVMHSNRAAVEPLPYCPGEDYTHLLGRLAQVEGVRTATSESVTWSGVRLFCTPTADSLWVETSPYANFAHDTIPHSTLTLRGILYHRNSTPRIVLIKGI